jgi:hypothetical protein
LQEPARNDIAAQGLIDHLNDIIDCVQHAGGDEVCPDYLIDLQKIRATVVGLKNKSYGTKLTCQSEIGKKIGEMEEETMAKTYLLSVSTINSEFSKPRHSSQN